MDLFPCYFCNTYLAPMKTKECPSCAMEVDTKSNVCPICKYQFANQYAGLKWAAIALALLFLFYLIYF